ncbi:MAG: hypothetical protein HQ498_09195 [Pseudohongiella sp.]|jgi:hypothetical protein|nr:hypothetical protein [Pseudohongiella sp.]
MTEESNVNVGMCWYQREQWELLKESAADPERLDDSYEEWKTGANGAIQDLEKQGIYPKKVSVRVSELIEWCNEKGYELNGKARSEFATYLLSKRA